jgi:hypothetical protein
VDHLGQFLGLCQVECHGLVTHDVEAGFGTSLGNLKMRMVRRGHRDEIDALVRGQLELGGNHVLDRAIGALGLDIVIGGGCLGPGGIGRKGAGDKYSAIVHDRRRGMHAPDEGALPAADQSHAELTAQRWVGWHGEISREIGVCDFWGRIGGQFYLSGVILATGY